jgi:hypothetical protein
MPAARWMPEQATVVVYVWNAGWSRAMALRIVIIFRMAALAGPIAFRPLRLTAPLRSCDGVPRCQGA